MQVIIAVIAIVVVLLMVILWMYRLNNELCGVWTAPADFTREAEISHMQVVIKAKSAHTYDCYVSMDGVVEYFSLYCWLYGRRAATQTVTAVVTYDDEATAKPFPERLSMEICLAEGRMVLSDDDTTYAVLFKDMELTYIAAKIGEDDNLDNDDATQ
jgi:hypothetical protein